MISKLRLAIDRLLLKLFSTTVSVRVILLWKVFHAWCSLVSSVKTPTTSASDAYNAEGVYIFDFNSSFKKVLQDKVDNCNSVIGTEFPVASAKNTLELPRKNYSALEDLVWLVLSHVKDDIESVFKSHFSTYWVQVYRTVPRAHEDLTSSFAWHYDEDPRQLLKLFIYLDDTSVENGAFRYLNRVDTRNLIDKGFISNTPSRRLESQCLVDTEIESKAIFVEGLKGTVFLFDNNIVHRGTFPSRGQRTVVAIELMPSTRELTYENVCRSISEEIIDDFPKNPWVNRYM